MGRPCNENIRKALEMARELHLLADQGDAEREDDGCGILFGIVRDAAYKIGRAAEAERERHRARGVWD